MAGFGRVRRALLALAVGGFAIGTGEFVMLGLLPQVAGSLHVGIPQAGELVSGYALGVVVGAPLLTAGTVAHRRRRVLLGLLAWMAVGNVASALAPSFGLELAARFLTGLPHGAFFGVGSVVAGGLVRAERRTVAMSVMFAGLTVANIVGVPLSTLLGQQTSWRWVYGLVAVFSVLGAVLVAAFVPDSPGQRGALRGELAAFAQPQVWLTLAVTVVGGAGLFATFSYIVPIMTRVAGYGSSAITGLLVLFGLGMTVGNLVGARLADRALMPTLLGGLGLELVVALVFVPGAHSKVASAILIFAFPASALSILPALQSRIITLAGGAPNLAAASIQGGFNVANSLGAYLGGLAIAHGYGYTSPDVVAAVLVALGIGLAVLAARAARHGGRSPDAAPAPAPLEPASR